MSMQTYVYTTQFVLTYLLLNILQWEPVLKSFIYVFTHKKLTECL